MKPSKVELKKQPQKYLSKVDGNTYKKLRKALDGLEKWEGDIVKLKNSDFEFHTIDLFLNMTTVSMLFQ